MTIYRRLKENDKIHKAEIPRAGCKDELQLTLNGQLYEKTSN